MTDTEQITGNSWDQLQNFIRQASVGMIVLTGEEMRVQVVNEMYGALFGRSPEELQGKSIFDIIPEAEAAFKPILDGVRQTGTPHYLYDHPYTVLDKLGENVKGYLNLVYQPYRDSNEVITGVMVLCHDVTAQVEARKLIQEANEKHRLAIESADLGTYELDMRSGALKVSDRFKAIWGIEGEFSKDTLVAMIHPDDRFIREEALSQSLITGQLFYEVRLIFRDKAVKWIRVNGKALLDNNSNPVSLIGVIQDITNQKDYTENLNRLVQERTEEWQTLNEELAATNEELSEANDRLRIANRELEQFAYVASHDLQEPLRKLQVFSNLLKERFESELNPGARGFVDKISASASRMAHLIKDLLDYSRLSHNKPLFQITDLNRIVTNVLNDFELTILQKNVTIHTDQLPEIEAIPIQMNQLFYNLIGNALKFIRKGVSPQIQIKCEALSDKEIQAFEKLKPGKAYFRFSICDNGIGFSQQYADQIFVIFQQLNEKSKYGGYGIGLSLCKRIVENHHGLIYATGFENEGATFTFIIPAKHH